MTGIAKPHDLQRFGVVGMVSLRNTYHSASRAVVGTLQFPSLKCIRDLQSSAHFLRMFSIVRSSVLSSVLAVFLFLFGASASLPFLAVRGELLPVFLCILFLIGGFLFFVERVSAHPKRNDAFSVFPVFLSVVGFLNVTVLEGHRSIA